MKIKGDPPNCSFCGQAFDDSEAPGVAGPAVFKCRDCIGLCIEIMAADAPGWLRAKIDEVATPLNASKNDT